MLTYNIDLSNIKLDIDEYNNLINDSSIIYQILIKDILPLLADFVNIPSKFIYRDLAFENDNLSSIFQQLEENYLCVFKFDNVNKTISIYSRESLNQDSMFILTPDNYVMDINYQPDFSKIITRLYIKGKDNLTIAGINPTGQTYIDDFSYFESFMSKELKDFLDSYYNEIKTNNVEDILNKYQSEALRLENEKADYMTYYYQYEAAKTADEEYSLVPVEQRTVKQQNDFWAAEELLGNLRTTALKYDVDNSNFSEPAIVDGTIYNSYDNYKRSVYSGVDIDEVTEIKVKFEYAIGVITKKIVDLQSQYELKRYFFNHNKEDLYSELAEFIIEGDLDVNYLYDEKQAYYYAQQYLKQIQKIPIQVTINIVNLLKNNNYFYQWCNILNIGKYVYISSPQDLIQLEKIKFISYTYTHSSNTIVLTFSNEDEITDTLHILSKNILGYTLKLSDKMDYYQSLWKNFSDMKDKILLDNSELNTGNNLIKDGTGNVIANAGGLVLNSGKDNGLIKTPTGLYSKDFTDDIDNLNKVISSGGISSVGGLGLLVDGIYIDELETNIKAYLCKPTGFVMKTTEGKTQIKYPAWNNESEKNYTNTNSLSADTLVDGEETKQAILRPYIHLVKEKMTYEEKWLNKPENWNKITLDELEELTINNHNLYWTAVEGNNAFDSISFSPPITYDSLSNKDSIINDFYKVRILKSLNKKFVKFNQSLRKTHASNNNTTYEPYTI